MKALILAGGFGTRLKEVISDRPKVMAPINGKPFLEFVIQLLRKNGIKEIVISLGYLGDYIKAYFGDGTNFGVKIEYAVEDFPLGTAGAIKNAQAFLRETFLVINGDTYIDTDIFKIVDYHILKKSLATITLVKRNKASDWGWVSLNKSGRVRAFIEKPKEDKSGWVSGGYYIFDPKIIKYIEKGKKCSIEKQLFPILVKKKILQGYVLNEDFMEIGKPENYEKVKEYFSHKKNIVIEVKAPVRISFAGGGTDLPEYFMKHGGKVFSGSIETFAHVKLKSIEEPFIKINLKDYKREETYPLGKILPYDGGIFDLFKAVINRLEPNIGINVEVWGEFPAGSGLGSSSAVCAAFISAILKLKKHEFSKKEITEKTIEIERNILKIPGGWQDQYSVTLGGLNLIEFLPKGIVNVKPLKMSQRLIKKFEKSLILFYIGAKRSEKEQQTGLRRNIISGKNPESFEKIKVLATKTAGFIKKGDVKTFGKLLNESWNIKKAISKNITDARIDEFYEIALKKGAYGGKLLGAGGGGCLLICAPERSHISIIRNLKTRGAIRLPFTFDFEGIQIKSYES